MSRTRGHGRRTRRRNETWSRRASAAGVTGYWLDAQTKRLTHRAERRAPTTGCEFCGSRDHDWCTAKMPTQVAGRKP